MRRAWFRNRIETLSVVAPNRTQALKEASRRFPKTATVTVKFVRNVKIDI